MVTIGAWALRDVATFFEAYQHPKDLGNRAAELARHVAFCESRRLAGEQLQYIQAFLKSWCRVPSGRFRRLCLHRLLNPTTVRVNANGNDADGINESSCSLGPLTPARRIVEILSHFENFLTKAQKLAY